MKLNDPEAPIADQIKGVTKEALEKLGADDLAMIVVQEPDGTPSHVYVATDRGLLVGDLRFHEATKRTTGEIELRLIWWSEVTCSVTTRATLDQMNGPSIGSTLVIEGTTIERPLDHKWRAFDAFVPILVEHVAKAHR